MAGHRDWWHFYSLVSLTSGTLGWLANWVLSVGACSSYWRFCALSATQFSQSNRSLHGFRAGFGHAFCRVSLQVTPCLAKPRKKRSIDITHNRNSCFCLLTDKYSVLLIESRFVPFRTSGRIQRITFTPLGFDLILDILALRSDWYGIFRYGKRWVCSPLGQTLGWDTLEKWMEIKNADETIPQLARISRLFGAVETTRWISERFSGSV
jgi:hypothetical protein